MGFQSVLGISLTKDFAKNIFADIDLNKDDRWSFDEAVKFIPKLEKKVREKIDGLTNLREIFNGMDLNGDDHIDKAEFKKALNKKLKNVFSSKNSKLGKDKQQIFIDR